MRQKVTYGVDFVRWLDTEIINLSTISCVSKN